MKPELLKAVLAEKGFFRVIVFARTRSRAESSCRRLRKAGYKVETIHSDRSQNQRKRALDSFAKGDVNIITATDVLARGIDVDQVDYVINYDVPDQPEDYIHRIGRTGRAGATGLAITFVTPETESALRDIEKLVKQKIPEMKLESFDLAAAEAEAASKAIGAQARRDPEVNKVKRELANRAQKKTAHQKQQQKEGARHRKPANASGARSKKATPTRKQKKQAKGDFRPGRAHRAEVQRSRSRRQGKTR